MYEFTQDILDVYGVEKFVKEMSIFNINNAIEEAVKNKAFISQLENIDICSNRLADVIYNSSGTLTTIEKTLVNILETSCFYDLKSIQLDIKNSLDTSIEKPQRRFYRKR